MHQSTLGSRCDETGDISFEFDIFHEFPRRNLTGDGHAHRVEIHMPRHRGPRRIRVRDIGEDSKTLGGRQQFVQFDPFRPEVEALRANACDVATRITR